MRSTTCSWRSQKATFKVYKPFKLNCTNEDGLIVGDELWKCAEHSSVKSLKHNSPCIQFINEVPERFGSMWMSCSLPVGRGTLSISDQGLYISECLLCVSHLFNLCMSRNHTKPLLLKSVTKNQCKPVYQVDLELCWLFSQSRKVQPVSQWGGPRAEVSCQQPGEGGAVQRASSPSSPVSLQPAHADAIAPSLSGGCLDAVKSCF